MVSAIQSLRKLVSQDFTHEHHAAYVEQVVPDTNHRGACLILTANVETALDKAIETFLNLSPESRLLQADDMFNAFARRIELGYALRIYGNVTKNNLTVMRHIRNAFAHAKIPLTFDTPEVAAVCSQFTVMPVLPPAIVRPEPDKATMSPRRLFEEIAQVLSHNLVWWSLEPVQHIDVAAFTLGQDPRYPIYYRRKQPLP